MTTMDTAVRPRLALLLIATAMMATVSVGRLVLRWVHDAAAGLAHRAQVDEVGAQLGAQITALESTVLDAVDEVAASRPRPRR
jgi:hypothetical protein